MTKRKQQFALLAAILPAAIFAGPLTAFGTTYNYSGDTTSASWNNSALWGGVSYPQLAGDVANVTRDFSTAPQQGLTINVPITLGILNLGDTGATSPENVSIGSTANILTFDNSGSAAQINQISTAGLGFIVNPIQIMGDLQISNASASALSFQASAVSPVSGTGSFASAAGSGTQTITFGGTGTGGGAISAPISNGSTGGTVVVTVNGGGTWTFSSPSNSYTGATTVSAGTLSLSGAGAVLGNTPITVNGGTFSEASNGSLGASASLTVNTSGTATLAGVNAYTGTTTVAGGTLNLNGSLNGTAITVSNGTFNQANGAAGSLTGATSLTVSGGVAQLFGTGSNNYSGATSLTGGQLQYNATSRLSGNSNINFNGGLLVAANNLTFSDAVGTGNGQVQWTGSGGFSTTTGNSLTIQLNGGTGTVTWAGTGAASGFVPNGSSLLFGSANEGNAPDFQNGIDLNGATRTVFVSPATGTGQISGSIIGTGSSSVLLKDGPGTLILKVSNSYSGGTIVQNGTLAAYAIVNTDASLGTAPATAAVNLTLDGSTFRAAGFFPIGATRTVQLNGGGTLNTTDVSDATKGSTINVNGTIQGTGGLTITGKGTVTLSGTNTYTGGTTVTGNSSAALCNFVLGNNNSLTSTQGALSLTDTKFDTKGFNVTVTSLTGMDTASSITNSNQNVSGTFTVNNTDSSSFAGLIGNEASPVRPIALTKSGTGSLLLSGPNNFTGAVIVSSGGGTLQLGNPNALGFGGTLNAGTGNVRTTTVNTGGTVDLDAQTVDEPIVLSGGSLINSSTSTAAKVDNGLAGIQFASGSSGYSGTITVSITGTGSGATATAVQTSGAITAITTTTAGSGYTSGTNVSITGGGGSNASATAILSSVSLTGTSNSIGGAGNLAIPAVISGSGGGFTKTGNGILTLSGSNAYTGGTTVSGGTLLALNTAGSATGTGNVIINSPGSLGGTGTVTGHVTANSGSTIFPGPTISHATASTLSVGPLTLNSAALDFSIGGTLGSNDLLAVTGAVTATGTDTINVAALTGLTSLVTGNYTVITGTGGLGTSAFTLGSSTLTVGTNTYTLALTNSTATSEIISIGTGSANGSSEWTNAGSDNNWETAGNWQGGVIPGVVGNVATFSTVSTPVTANLSANETVGGLTFNGNGSTVITATAGKSLTLDNSNSGVAVNVTGSTSIAAPVVLNDNATVTTATSSSLSISGNISGSKKLTTAGTGSVTLPGSNSYGGGTEVSGGTLNIQSTTALPTGSNLTVDGSGTLVANRNGGGRITLDLNSLSNSGLIDLQNNTMVLHTTDPSVVSAVQGELQSGFHNGGWNGVTGIISSTAQNSSLYTLGNVFDGTNLKVAYTYYGDTDLSGVIDGTDYSVIDTNNGMTTGGTWQTGDFNYDGHVDGSDYSLIDNAFNTQNGNAVTASEIATNTSEIAGGSAAVPEPASLGLLGVGAMGLMSRRRRRM